ncbi:MAG: hypothetical protein IBX55_16135 [Methyloprofundus sp.]|nr:hypothetical protein [Methyloprofundus sp.]
MIKAEDFIIEHSRIIKKTPAWDLNNLIHIEGTEVYRNKKNWRDEVDCLPVATDRIWLINGLKEYFRGLLDTGSSVNTIVHTIRVFAAFISFIDKNKRTISDVNELEKNIYDYAEYLYQRECRKEIASGLGYSHFIIITKPLNDALEIALDVRNSRLTKKVKARRAVPREADKMNLEQAAKLAKFAYDITQNFNPDDLHNLESSVFVKVRDSILEEPVNLTPRIGKGRPNSSNSAFNHRVSAEIMVFLAMTTANISIAHNLKRCRFDYKLNRTGDKYELREFKHRKGGEVLIRIPKSYRSSFESYLAFLDDHAQNSEWVFPYLNFQGEFNKRIDNSFTRFQQLCKKHNIPWVAPSIFRKTGLNLLLRLSASEDAAADHGSHAVKTFRESYEFPSQQRAMVEIARFWDESDPLAHGKPKVSLFGTPCSGNPEPFSDVAGELVKPDCQTPTGCINCKHYRDEESLDYVWNLCSFRYLKIIESNSYLDKREKPSNIAIDWANLKVKWFKNSKVSRYNDWVEESEMRIEEGDYHPNWSRRIANYEV